MPVIVCCPHNAAGLGMHWCCGHQPICKLFWLAPSSKECDGENHLAENDTITVTSIPCGPTGLAYASENSGKPAPPAKMTEPEWQGKAPEKRVARNALQGKTKLLWILGLSAAYAITLNGTLIMPVIVPSMSKLAGYREATATIVASAELAGIAIYEIFPPRLAAWPRCPVWNCGLWSFAPRVPGQMEIESVEWRI
jgi:hypothetical protein